MADPGSEVVTAPAGVWTPVVCLSCGHPWHGDESCRAKEACSCVRLAEMSSAIRAGHNGGMVENEAGGVQSASDYFFRGLPMLALLRIARIMREGATSHEKVDPFGDVLVRNWHRIPSTDHIEHSGVHLLQHVAGMRGGEDHLAHYATRALMALEMYLRETGEEP